MYLIVNRKCFVSVEQGGLFVIEEVYGSGLLRFITQCFFLMGEQRRVQGDNGVFAQRVVVWI